MPLVSPFLPCRWRLIFVFVLVCAISRLSVAQAPSTVGNTEEQQDAPNDPATMFPHSDRTRWYVAGQINIITQGHPAFDARYSGPNSLKAVRELKQSRVLTLFTGLQVTRRTEVLLDVESAGGRGISDALGLAGFTNLDVVRNPDLGTTPYLARVMLRQIVPLSKTMQEAERNFANLAVEVPTRRLEFRLGKFGVSDFFDTNAVGSDSHTQFLNWTVDNNGAYDYAADTRGYTWGAMAEYQSPSWGLRFGEMLMPKIANGINLEWSLRKARAENIELELRAPFSAGHKTTLRLLSFVNHANMGAYREAIQLFRAGLTPTPDIIATRKQGRVKYGFGLNLEQQVSSTVRTFARVGWNEGRHESFAYTEVDQTVAFGADWHGRRWKRPSDKVGATIVTNGISRDHQLYLKLGGLGFLLGDGNLNYGREDIFETYYTAHIWRGIYVSPDLQYINHPGYNRDRGPVWVPALRLHFEL